MSFVLRPFVVCMLVAHVHASRCDNSTLTLAEKDHCKATSQGAQVVFMLACVVVILVCCKSCFDDYRQRRGYSRIATSSDNHMDGFP